MSSVVVDRPVVTTPSSEWGSDPTVTEDRHSPRYTPTSYFRPASRSSPYSRPHPPTSGEFEVPGSYPRDPRDALDHLSASAQDNDFRVQDFLPAKEDVQNAMSNVGDAAMGAIGAVGAAGASLVAAASGEGSRGVKDDAEPTPMDNSVPFINNDQTDRVTGLESDTFLNYPNAIAREEQPLIIPADLPSAPFLVPMTQSSEGQIDAAPAAATSIAETTLTGDDAADYVLFERNLRISAGPASSEPTDALGDYSPISAAHSNMSLGILERSEPDGDIRAFGPPANNASIDSFGSETGVGHGLGLSSSGEYHDDTIRATRI